MEKRWGGPGVVGSGCGCCEGTGLRVVGVEMVEATLATGRRRLRTETAGVGVIEATVAVGAVGTVGGGEGGGLCW